MVVVVLIIGVAILLPVLAWLKPKSARLSCINNLKQIDLAYKLWAGDNGDKYPMEVSVTNGGTMELMGTSDAWKTFLVMSNELSTPRILFCPNDMGRKTWATNFSDDLKGRINYFIGLDTGVGGFKAFLAGDDNFEIGGQTVQPGLLGLTANSDVAWDSTRHQTDQVHFWTPARNRYYGNIVCGDGRAWIINSDGLRDEIGETGLATNRLIIP